jgi:photosystem II stability/assembly factor-like uncharacterized protein
VDFASDGTAYVALGFPFGGPINNGIYKSKAPAASCAAITGSTNWTKQTLPLSASSLGRIALAIAPSSDATIYAAIADSTTTSSNLLGVVKTTNGGASWTQLTAAQVSPAQGFCNAQCFYDLVIAVSPVRFNNQDVVYAGGAANNATLIRSADGGATWTEVSNNRTSNNGIHVDMHAIAISQDGNSLYVGNDGGVWKATANVSSSKALTWQNLNATLNITQFYPGHSIHPSTPF